MFYQTIVFLTNKLTKSKEQVRSLLKEVKDLKWDINSSSTTETIQGRTSNHVKLEKENFLLKAQVEDPTVMLERLMSSSKYLLKNWF